MFKRSLIIGSVVACLALGPAAAFGASGVGPLAALSGVITRFETASPGHGHTKAPARLRSVVSKVEAKDVETDDATEAPKPPKTSDDASAALPGEPTSKHLQVLQGVLNKVPDQAKDAIRHAIEVSSHGSEKATATHGRAGGPGVNGRVHGNSHGNPHGPK